MAVVEDGEPTLSEALTRRVEGFGLAGIPADVTRRARLVLLDTIGEMVASSGLAYDPLRKLSGTMPVAPGGSGGATVVGRGAAGSTADAAYLNAALAAAGLRDSLHVATAMHAAAVVGGALIALAEPGRTTGADFLAAFVLGVEVACRVSDALDPAAVYGRGFHPTAVCGTFGAAAGAGRLLGLRGEQMAAVFGLALQHAAGHAVWLRDGTDSMRFLSPATAARNGATAAVLAAAGLGSEVRPFDGDDSVFSTFSAAPRPARLLGDWGARFFVGEMTYKLYASCTYTHAALDAVLALRNQHGFVPDAVASIRVTTTEAAFEATTKPALRSCYAPHVIALGLTTGGVSIGDSADADPTYRRLAGAIAVASDPDAPAGSASVEVTLADGRVLGQRVTAARGTQANPLGEDEILAKFATAAGRAAAPARIAAIQDAVLDLERVGNFGTLLVELRTPFPPAQKRPTERR